MSQFKVGDVCVFVDSAVYAITGESVAGIECTVVGGIEERFIWPPGERRVCYEVMCEQLAKHPVLAEPHELRPKHVPPDDTHIPAEDEFTDWLKSQLRVKA